MTAVADPFLPVLDVLDRYRHDVHQLQPPPNESAAEHARRHLPIPVPASLGRFLDRWNGASLFRGSLQVRSIHELALASQQAAQVVVFADGPSDQQWAFVPHGDGFLFGRWTGTAFQPLHDSFEPWLHAMVSILAERKTEPGAQLAARLDADPNGPYLSLEQIRNHLRNQELDSAFVLLDGLDTGLVEQALAWHDLGQAWLPSQPEQARNALLRAIHTLHLPCQYPTTPLDGARLMSQLESLVDARDTGWSEQLEQILSQQITDTRQTWEIELAEAIALALSRALLAQGERTRARDSLRDFLHRARSYQLRTTCVEAILAVARLETDLGHHDEAENYLRQLRDAPAPIRARANLVLGRLAATRQEPWAEQILQEARRHMEDPADICESMILEGERLLHLGRHGRARELFERALEQATASDLVTPIALAHLGLGDLYRVAGETNEAQEHYQQARERAGDFGELKLRLMIRHGDLLREEKPKEAAGAYATAADGYRRLQLPIREAWACLRLTQVDEPGGTRAYELFKETDLAAGVAACDALTGDAARSLDWHLERATEHARRRASARRARPPLSRSDADRPERRIGAHRTAIAACSDQVVRTFARELDHLGHQLSLTHSRLTDPNLARYIATADLLAAHRSYEAAKAFLDHLTQVRPTGAAEKALIGALARSPNVALVDGLLEIVETRPDPKATAIAVEVLGWRREQAATELLNGVVSAPLGIALQKAAIVALGRIGEMSAIPALLPALDTPELGCQASIALLLLGNWDGIDYQAQALAINDPNLGSSAGELVGRYGGPSYLLLLYRTAQSEGPAGYGALHGLGYLGDPRAVPHLLEATTSRDPTRRKVASTAIELITGRHEDPEEAMLAHRWNEWWHHNEGNFAQGTRYRHGEPLHAGLLVDRLGHDEALVRLACYDELVITTGVGMPFDAEGPYRVQLTHRNAWANWWRENRTEQPVGRWTFHGEPIG